MKAVLQALALCLTWSPDVRSNPICGILTLYDLTRSKVDDA